MDFNELKKLIRTSLRLKIKEISAKKSAINSFSDFRRGIALSLEREGVLQSIVDEILLHDGGIIFESVYEAWESIELETQHSSARSRSDAWNEVAPYYISKSVIEVLSGTSHERSAEEISGRVVSRMMI